MAKAKRTTHRSSKGKKLHAVRDASGKFKDIQTWCTFDDAIENIDIGGPAMLRAAAKNHESVAVVVDPGDYGCIVEELKDKGAVSAATRLALAKKVFAHTSRYDGAIANYLTALDAQGSRGAFPDVLSRQWVKVQQMRYGENPHQHAAFYRERDVAPGLLAGYAQLQGKELSCNNIADADAAWDCVRSFDEPACVIIKHANPCGVAVGGSAEEAYSKAFKTDPTSAFGDIIAVRYRPVAQDSRWQLRIDRSQCPGVPV